MTVAALKKSFVRERLAPEIAGQLFDRKPAEQARDVDARTRFRLFGQDNWHVVLASLCINLLGLALPLAIYQVYDRILPNNASNTLTALIVGLTVVTLFDGLLRIARSVTIAWQGSRFEHAVGCEAVERLTAAAPEEIKSKPVGRRLEGFQAIDTLREFYGGAALMNFLEIPFVVIFLAMVFLIGGPLGFVPLGLFILCGAFAFLLGRKLKAQISKRHDIDMLRFNFILEVLNGLQNVKTQAQEALMSRRYERLQATASASGYNLVRTSAWSQACGAFFSYFVLFSTAATGSLMVLDGALSQGGLAACSLLAGRAVQPFLRSMAFWAQYQGIRVAKEELADLMNSEPEVKATAPKRLDLSGRIEFRDVCIAFKDREILRDANVIIEPGETILLEAPTGGGKSCVLNLCNGFLAPTSGSIRLDGVDLQEQDLANVRRQVAFLTEKSVLFHGTILDNLTLFDPQHNLDRAMELVVQLGLDRAVARLPNGFATEVGDDLSELLPSGIRQQIGIVRALSPRPKIILFDQANGGLDMESDKRLLATMRRLQSEATIIMATHRPSYFDLADRKIWIEGGRLFDTAAAPRAVLDKIRMGGAGLKVAPASARETRRGAPANPPAGGGGAA